MNPYKAALNMYDTEEELSAVVTYCMEHGEVHSDSDCFICGYTTNSSLLGHNSNKSIDIADTWFIYIAIGNLKRIFDTAQKLKYVAYERNDGKFRVIETERFARLYNDKR